MGRGGDCGEMTKTTSYKFTGIFSNWNSSLLFCSHDSNKNVSEISVTKMTAHALQISNVVISKTVSEGGKKGKWYIFSFHLFWLFLTLNNLTHSWNCNQDSRDHQRKYLQKKKKINQNQHHIQIHTHTYTYTHIYILSGSTTAILQSLKY